MNPPDWSCCTEEELWHYVGWHLQAAGVGSVLVGGAVVAIYTEGLYRSGDLDLIPNDLHRGKIPNILRSLGFHSSKSRYFKHPRCPHLFLEFPRGPVEIGEECPVVPDEIEVAGKKLQLLSPTDCVKDRLAGYIHWKSRANFEQALLVCRKQARRVDLKAVERWCKREGGLAEYVELQRLLSGPE
jgi:hypothetical protein